MSRFEVAPDGRTMLVVNWAENVGLVAIYHSLYFDIRHKANTSPKLSVVNRITKQKFKRKVEAFRYLHDLLEVNGEPTLDICSMGDCPKIKTEGIPDKSIGSWTITWKTITGNVTESRKLCQDCKDYLTENNIING